MVLMLILNQISAQDAVLMSNLGHSKEITALEYSPDFKYLASASKDGVIKLWNAALGKEIKTFRGHSFFVNDIAFSPNGKNLVSVSADQTIRLWSVDSETEMMQFAKQMMPVNAVAYSADGSKIYTAIADGTVKIWNAQTGENLNTLSAHSSWVENIALSPDGKYFVTSSWENKIKLWNAQNNELLRPLVGLSLSSAALAFSPNSKWVAAGSRDKNVAVWNSETGELQTVLKGHTQEVWSVRFSPNNQFLATASADKTVIIWDWQKGTKLLTILENSVVFSLLFSESGKEIAIGNAQAEINIRQIADGTLIKQFKGYSEDILCINFSADGGFLASGSSNSSIKIWNTQNSKDLKPLKADNKSVLCLKFSPNQKFMVSGSASNVLNYWDLSKKQVTKTMGNFVFGATALDISPDSKIIAATNYQETALFDAETGKQILRTANINDIVSDIVFSPDGKSFAIASWDGSARLYDTQTGNELFKYIGHKGYVECVAFSPNGKYLATGSWDNSVRLWEVETGKTVFQFNGHTDKVVSLSFNPNGNQLVSASHDNTLKIWNVNNGTLEKTLTGHTAKVFDVEFSPDGRRIASAASDATIRFWSSQNGTELLRLYSMSDSKDFIAVTPSGKFDGTPAGIDLLFYLQNGQIVPLESFYEQYFTPRLFETIFAVSDFDYVNGENLVETVEPKIEVKLPPEIKIISPNKETKTFRQNEKGELLATTQEIELWADVYDKGTGVSEIRVFHNQKLIESDDFLDVGEVHTKKIKIQLLNGKNTLKITAFNTEQVEAVPQEIDVYFNGNQSTTSLYMLVVGINEYQNPDYKLNYALADATSFQKELELGSKSLFEKIETVFLGNENASFAKIQEQMQLLKSKVKPEDVFIFYYAGHGIMSQDAQSQFFLVPYDLTNVNQSTQELENKAISARNLKVFSKEIKARKQMFVFDACHSGGLLETLISMGNVAEEKAIAQLARSTGTFWLTASTTEQFAAEFGTLGHGVFTYSILYALQGKAENLGLDKKITVQEISTFVNENVPELSEKYKGKAQYPVSFGFGQDFPLILLQK